MVLGDGGASAPGLACATGASMARATSILLIAWPHACCVSWSRRPNAATDSGRSAGSFVNPSSMTSATAAGTPRERRSGGASSAMRLSRGAIVSSSGSQNGGAPASSSYIVEANA